MRQIRAHPAGEIRKICTIEPAGAARRRGLGWGVLSAFRRWPAAALLALSLAFGGADAVQADQTHPALDPLFRALKAAEDPRRIGAIEARIWRHWFLSGSAAVDEMFRRGGVALARGRLREAHAFFDAIVARRPDMAEGWNRRATARYLMGDYAGSIQDIAETLAREPRHFGALSGLGLCHLARGEKERALRAFRRALRHHPHMPAVKRHVERLRIALYGPEI